MEYIHQGERYMEVYKRAYGETYQKNWEAQISRGTDTTNGLDKDINTVRVIKLELTYRLTQNRY